MSEIQTKILEALKNPNFPDFKFLYSPEVLAVSQELLEELLEQEKQKFSEKLKTKDEDIVFDTFDDFSLLEYFFGILEHYQGVNNDDVIREIIENFEPKYIDFGNEISYSSRYYEMLQLCLKNCDLDSEQTRILEQSVEAYQVRGIALEDDKQTQLKQINKDLGELSQKFSNNVLDSQKLFEYVITDENIISEMPEDDKQVAKQRADDKQVAKQRADDKQVAKQRADDKNVEGYLFDASQGAYISIMKYCSDSSVRKDFYDARNHFGTGGKYNNKPVILDTLRLRNNKAQLLGFKNYAELSLHFKMAESPEQIVELFGDISQKAKVKGQAELDEIKEYFNLDTLNVWDLSYYANKLREEKYSFDSKELKKYFEFEAVLKGMFDIVGKLYGIEMKKLDIESYDEDVQIYEVSRNGEFLSYFFTDYFFRPLKRHGAWANIMREKFGTHKKITLNVCNFQKGSDGKTLLTLGDVETMFHEFGHASHEMLSRSQHSELTGFHVEWDFIELPSQLLENWCRDRQGMKLFAAHHETGAPVPEEMLQKLELLDTFGNGQMVLTQNSYAMMDMGLHSQTLPESEEALDKRVQENYDISALLPRSESYSPHTSFTHIFDGGYAAGYYSYMWAEIIEKEVWKAFKDSGDIFSPDVSKKFHDTILSAGTTKKAPELFRDFFGRDVEIDAFLSEKGLI